MACHTRISCVSAIIIVFNVYIINFISGFSHNYRLRAIQSTIRVQNCPATVLTQSLFAKRNYRDEEKNARYENEYDDDDDYYEDEYSDFDYQEYDDEDDSDYETDEPQHEWESYNGVDILLPPPSSTPRAIIHFIGGTFLGSLPPRIIYASFLEGLAKECHTPIIILATPIPFLQDRFRFISPLDHARKVRSIRQMLKDVYNEVLTDEYPRRVLKDVPMIGVGHSLGGRLHVLLNARREMLRRSRVKGNVLISFNNWNAEESVPLLNGVKNVIETAGEGEEGGGRRRRRRPRRRSDYFDDDEEEDGYERPRREKPLAMFEFNPPPQTLWEILDGSYERKERGGFGHYSVSQNLIVQFDQDELDQSSELANRIISCASHDKDDLKFAILEGTHLTPCLGIDDILQDPEDDGDYGPPGGKGRREKRKRQIQDLILSVATYIDDVVAKEEKKVLEEQERLSL